MRLSLLVTLVIGFFVCAVPASAALPYYNQELGYTIWLPKGWGEAPQHLNHFYGFDDGVKAEGPCWQACYGAEAEGGACLLVSEIHGRVVSQSAIANFNSFVVRQLLAGKDRDSSSSVSLRSAHFDKKKSMLRLEMDGVNALNERTLSVVYIVYTGKGMLKFVGVVHPTDSEGIDTIDAAMTSLYVDHGLRQ